ncbi:hypothetical protein [Pseudoalteromonas sp. MER144-MNA-CIBAN-0113]|uniref:hypothetical protein n=1 Tax=Pseudoalteromonas sp. MER144-MNA-CIBAN-0113 TaxID=3140429 RepID=UPI00331766FE
MKLNETDLEILAILKNVFLSRNIKPLASDHYLRIWMIRCFFYVSVLCLITRIVIGLQGEDTALISSLLSVPTTFFFGTLFLHINNECENTSLLVLIITWVSIVIALFA